MLRLSVVTLLLSVMAPAALANGLSIPKEIKPSFNGTYIVRGKVQTNNAVAGLRYGVFHTVGNKSVGEPVEGVTLRPNVLTTRAGFPRPFVATVPSGVSPETPLALCLWRENAELAASDSSQLRVLFRFCRFFKVLPERSPSRSSTGTP